MHAVAHRGYSSDYPENTLLAFEKAIRAGSKYVETDLRFSKDGTIVCSHDEDFSRVLNRDEVIANLDVGELKKVDTGDGKGVPSFEEVLDLCEARCGMFLDVKITSEQMVDAVLETLSLHPSNTDVVFGARRHYQLHYLRSRNTQLPVIGMIQDFSEIPQFLRLGVQGIRIWEEDLTPQIVEQIHQTGHEVWVTSGLRSTGEITGIIDRARLQHLLNLKINAVLVNDPSQVISLQEKYL